MAYIKTVAQLVSKGNNISLLAFPSSSFNLHFIAWLFLARPVVRSEIPTFRQCMSAHKTQVVV